MSDTPAVASAGPVPLIDLSGQYRSIQREVDAAIAEVVSSQRFILGPPVEALEAALAEYVGVEHAIGCASGTDALLLPLRLLGGERGGDVVVPAFTFFATAGAVHNAGFRPVFCDVDEATYNVTAELVEEAWTPETVGMVPVHLFGQMAPMSDLMEMGRETGTFVLEDAAQAIGATQDRGGRAQSAGSVGIAGSFSFFPTKNLGGFGDGGLITTSDADLAARLREFRVHGGLQMYRHHVVGTNSRLDALQAAVLLAKLPHLHRWTDGRRANARRYVEGLADVAGVVLPATLEGNSHVYNQFTIRVADRDRLRAHLAERGIGSGVYYPEPLHLQECFQELGYRPGSLPVAERLCTEVISLPVFSELREDQVDFVIDAIREFHGAV